MRTRFGVDELDIDAHAVSAALDAALEDIANVQLAPDLFQIDGLALVSEGSVAPDNERASNARKIGRQALRDPVDEMLLLRVASDVGERQDDHREARGSGYFPRRGRRGLRNGRRADLHRIDPDRLGDVLELGRAEIRDRPIEPTFHLPIGLFGEANRARLANPFEARGDIDAIAHQIAVGLLDHVAEMDPDAELDAAIFRHSGAAFGHAGLHLDRATHGVDHAAKFDEESIAGAFDDAPAMGCYCRIDEIAAQPPETRQGALLVGAGEPAVADHVGDQDRSNFPGFGHGVAQQVGDVSIAGRSTGVF